jgi:hypothetical protein
MAKRRGTGNTMAKRRSTVNTMAKCSDGYSGARCEG